VAHILVVDDQTDICEVLKAGLETAPEFYVSCCNSGRDAIAILEEHRPDFAVVDVLIPGVAGQDVAKAAIDQKIPVLFMTGNPDTARELLDAQVPCIIKPFRLDYLVEQVRAQLKTGEDNLKRICDYLASRRPAPSGKP
jgi:DNA-binding response OmpR family regulator